MVFTFVGLFGGSVRSQRTQKLENECKKAYSTITISAKKEPENLFDKAKLIIGLTKSSKATAKTFFDGNIIEVMAKIAKSPNFFDDNIIEAVNKAIAGLK